MSNCFWLTQYTISIELILDVFMEKNREKILAVYQDEPQETTLDKIRTMNRENIHRLTDHLPSLGTRRTRAVATSGPSAATTLPFASPAIAMMK